MMKDLGAEGYSTVYVDSSAALAITNRKGCGKLRHINVGLLGLQEKETMEELTFKKVLGTLNPADAMPKNVNQDTLMKHCAAMAIDFKTGRADTGLEVQAGNHNRENGIVANLSVKT